MDAFESVADNDGFEEVEGPAEIVEPASASAPKEATPAPKEATPEPEPAPKENKPAPKEASDSGKTILGRSEKQRRVDAARAEQLRKLKERYNVEFANIQKKRPKPKAYNAASVLSAPDPEAKIKQILARDRAIYNEKQTRKGVKANAAIKGNVKANAVNKGNAKGNTKGNAKGNATANGPRVNTRKRNAPSILSSTRSAATQIKEKARADLKALKESAENELREIGANVSILHPIFVKAEPHKAEPHKAEHKAAPKSRSRTRVRSLPARLNQMTRNNN
jgi:hypothetical protein